MKQIKFYGEKGCTMIDGILQSIKVMNVTMDACGNMYYYTGGRTLKNPVLYYDNERFEKGEPISELTVYFDKQYEYKEETIESGDTQILTHVWQMVGGEPMRFSYALSFDITGMRATPILEEGMYKSREDCLRFSEYQFTDADGNVCVKVGLGKKVQLTEEQRNYIDKELIPMLHKATDLGIRLYFNNATDEIYAANLNNLENERKTLIMDYTCDVNTENDPSYITSEAFYKLPYNPILGESEESCYSE